MTCYIETSISLRTVSQWCGFCMRGTLVLNRLRSKFFCVIYSEQCLGNIHVAALTLLPPIPISVLSSILQHFSESIEINVFTK